MNNFYTMSLNVKMENKLKVISNQYKHVNIDWELILPPLKK